MSASPHRFVTPAAVLMAIGSSLMGIAGCNTSGAGEAGSERAATPKPATGRVLTRDEVKQRTATLFFGDDAYAEVNSQWLAGFYSDFRTELFRLGIVRWDERFDCNRFAEFYTGLAQARFYRESYHSNSPARALAIAPYWYVRANGRGPHAIVQALTERGQMFIDPQTGAEVQLSAQERASAYFWFF